MAHRIVDIRLDDVGECFEGFDFSTVARSSASHWYCRGMCYAYDLQSLIELQLSRQLAWHIQLLQHAIAGLWAQKSQQRALLAYELLPDYVRLFLLAKKQSQWPKVFGSVSRISGFIESGVDSVLVTDLRPMLLWEPPASATALWPVGTDGDTSAVRGVDTGNLSSYHSEVVDPTQAADAGLEFVRIPEGEEATFQLAGRDFSYLNQYVSLL